MLVKLIKKKKKMGHIIFLFFEGILLCILNLLWIIALKKIKIKNFEQGLM